MVSITIISIVALVALSFIPKKHPVEDPVPVIETEGSGGGGSSSDWQGDVETPQPEEVIKAKPVVQKEETPSVPTETLQNNQTTPVPSDPPQPSVVVNNNVTIEVPAGSTQTSPAPEQESQMAPIEKTYIIKKQGEVVKSDLSLDQVRSFVASLNTYVSWRKKAQSGTIEDLTQMLNSNEYTLE